MKVADIKNKSEKELQEMLAEKRRELRDLRFRAAENQLKDVRSIRNTRKDIARILTILSARGTMPAQKTD